MTFIASLVNNQDQVASYILFKILHQGFWYCAKCQAQNFVATNFNLQEMYHFICTAKIDVKIYRMIKNRYQSFKPPPQALWFGLSIDFTCYFVESWAFL